MAITARTLRLLRDLRATVGSLADDAVRQLTSSWVRAWDELAPAWQVAVDALVDAAGMLGRWPNPVLIAREPAVDRALAATDAGLVELVDASLEVLARAAGAAVTATAAAEPGVIASQVPDGVARQLAARAAAAILPTALDVITERVQQRITVQTRALSPAAADAVRRELVRGVAAGSDPDQAARHMLARVNGAFEGGLTRAVTIARTEILDAYRGASAYAHQANADVLDGWTWLATLSGTRTCPACWAMHGTHHPLSEPGPLDHPQGRCVRAPRVKPWPFLGLADEEPADAIPDAQLVFDALPEADQVAIMGPARLALLTAGQIGWDDLAERRTNSGWRDSWVPRPVRDLRLLAARRGT